jgi:hypothetical protein
MMQILRGMAATVGAALLIGGTVQAAPARAATPTGTGSGWHWVHEGWQPYDQADGTDPAARYCGSFDLKDTVVRQDIRSKVLSRWDNGVAKDTYYTGPLTMKVTNTSTGKSKNYDMGGDAIETDNSSGAMRIYRMIGPVGMGMPIGASTGLPPGVYVMSGYHEVRFDSDGTRTLTAAFGPVVNLCTDLG